jgi:hypothetical protein
MTGDYGIERAVWDTGEAVHIEIDVEIGCGPVRRTRELRPILVATTGHRAIGVADTRVGSDGKRLMPRANLKDVARESLSDNTARIARARRHSTNYHTDPDRIVVL